MIATAVRERIQRIEAEVRLLKASTAQQPDILVDEKNWQKIKPTLKKIRSNLYKERYA